MPSIDVLIGGQLTGLTAALNSAQEKLEGFTAPISGIQSAFAGMAEAAAAAFAVDRVVEFIDHMAELGAQVQHASQMLGESAEEVSTFDFAAKAMGVGADGANTALERLERNMSQAATEPGLAANAFQALGIKVTDSTGKLRQLDDILPEIADKFHDTADGPAKTAIAIALMGRSGAEMIPLLDQGRAGLEAFKQAAQDTGTVITGPMAEGMESTEISATTLGSAFEGVGITLFEAFKPAIDVVIKGLTDLVEGFNNSMREGGALNQVLGGIVITIDIIVAAIETFINALRALWDYAEGVLHNLTQGFTTLGEVMLDVATGKFSQVVSDFNAGWAKMSQNAAASFESLKQVATREVADIKQLFSNISVSPSAGGLFGVDTSGGAAEGGEDKPMQQLGAVSSLASRGSQDLSQMQQWHEALQQQLMDEQNFFSSSKDEELKYWQDKLATAQQYMAEYNLTLKQAQELHLQVQTQIFNLEKQQSQEWLQSYLAGLQEQAAALKQQLAAREISEQEYWNRVIALAQDKMNVLAQLYGQDSKQYAAALAEKVNLDRQESAQSAQVWKNAANTINSAFDQMLHGMLTGTQSFQQMMARLAENLVASFLESQLKIVVNWLVGEAEKTLATETGVAVRTAATVAGATAGKAAESSAASSSIFSSAERGAAAVYADVAEIPYVGWLLAPAAAAAAFAAIVAFGGGLGSFAEGSWNLPSDMIAQVHAGEMIVPAAVASQVRAGLPGSPFASALAGAGAGASGGGMALNLTIQAIDTQTGTQFLLNNLPTIARGLGTQFRNANANLRPS